MDTALPALKIPALALVLGVLVMAMPARAQGTIYRCHALSGALQFQDKPCNNTGSTTREAKSNSEGEIVAVAPPPAQQEGTPAVERYARYLDQVSKDRREQRETDEAETTRLRAQAAADRTAAAETARPGTAGCSLFGADGECVSAPYAYQQPYEFYQQRIPRRPAYRGPLLPTAPSAPAPYTAYTLRPLGPNQPPKGLSPDARSDVLSLAPGR